MSDSFKQMAEQAKSEGVTTDVADSPAPKSVESGANNVASPTTKTEEIQATNSPVADTAKSVELEPFHKNPRWQKMLQENKELKERTQRLEAKYQENLESIVRGQTQKVSPALPDEQRQALLQLVNLIKSDPDAAQALGLNQGTELKQQLESMQAEREQSQFNTELDSVSSSYALKYGMKADELKEELADYVASNPYFSSSHYQPGLLEAALNNMLFPKLSELSQREANLKLIQDREIKKSQNVETSSSGKPQGKATAGTIKQHLESRIREEGGISVD